MIYSAVGRISYRPNRQHMAVYLNAKLPQKDHTQSADRDARSSFASAGTLDDVANVIMSIFDAASKISVSGSSQRHRFDFLFDRGDAHLDLPVLPVAIFDFQRDGRTERQTVPHA